MNDDAFDPESILWCSIRANTIGVNLSIHPFDNDLKISIAQVYLQERERLKREILVIDQPSLITYKAWSLNAPTIGDCEQHVTVSFGGQPILLYDPIIINELTKYFRNMIDQSAENVHQIINELMGKQEKKKDVIIDPDTIIEEDENEES